MSEWKVDRSTENAERCMISNVQFCKCTWAKDIGVHSELHIKAVLASMPGLRAVTFTDSSRHDRWFASKSSNLLLFQA